MLVLWDIDKNTTRCLLKDLFSSDGRAVIAAGVTPAASAAIGLPRQLISPATLSDDAQKSKRRKTTVQLTSAENSSSSSSSDESNDEDEDLDSGSNNIIDLPADCETDRPAEEREVILHHSITTIRRTLRCDLNLTPADLFVRYGRIDFFLLLTGTLTTDVAITSPLKDANVATTTTKTSTAKKRNCEETGHRFSECTKPKRLRCYNCKTEGIKTTDCRCYSGNALWIPDQGRQLRSRYHCPTRPPTGKISCAEELTHYSDEHKRLDLVIHKESDKDFSAITTNQIDCRFPSTQPETSELTVCFPEGRQTVVTAWDPMLEAPKEAIDNNYEGNESSVTFSNLPDSEVKNAVSTSNRTECLSCHEMDKLKKESPTPNTYQDVNIQKEAAAEDDFEMVNECNVTLSRASSPCLSIMEDSERVDNELGIDFQETSLKTNLNSSTNCITTIRDTPQPIQPPPPEKTEAPEEINKHVLDCSLNVRNVQAASNKQKRYRPKRIRVFNPDGTFVRIDVRKLPPELR
ncbi:hypothetical protein J6590_076258 [Homalodisca vitripennis]|nr:hypothetical protein J6590_076258 [Homalodisca vitripennis]